jgi:hypothetical protein
MLPLVALGLLRLDILSQRSFLKQAADYFFNLIFKLEI